MSWDMLDVSFLRLEQTKKNTGYVGRVSSCKCINVRLSGSADFLNASKKGRTIVLRDQGKREE